MEFRFLIFGRQFKDDIDLGDLFKVGDNGSDPSIIVPVKIDDVNLNMELDSGTSLSVISEQHWKDKFPQVKLEHSNVRLRTYTCEELTIIGQATVKVKFEYQECELPVQIIKGNRPALLGQNWLRNIRLNWGTIKHISDDLDDVLTKHRKVSEDKLGTMGDVKAKLYVKPGSTPTFYIYKPH